MILRVILYGVLGWVLEILWTGLGSLLRGDVRLVCTTYLWMLPIYGGAGVAFEGLYGYLEVQPWWTRGTIWMLAIYLVEYGSGFLLRRWVGYCPWDYGEGPLVVDGLIRLDYAPAWFLLGLFYEQGHLIVKQIAFHVQAIW
jgi:uncharacterized membrane protein